LAAEFARSSADGFPASNEDIRELAGQRANASLAATLGQVRGDLWTECALTYLDLVLDNKRGAQNDATSNDTAEGRDVATRAVRLAPHDARAWLVFASLRSQYDWVNRNAAGALKMSYYTGPSEIALVPLRLLLAVRSDALTDTEFADLVSRDIRLAAAHQRELKPALVAAYRDALPAGKDFIEKALEPLDPALLSSIRPGS
jgi:hypothetical protein